MFQIFLYGCVGLTSAATDFIIFFCTLPLLNNNYILASMVAFSIAVTVNFTLCNFFIFKRNNISLLYAYRRHIASNIFSFLLSLLLLKIFIQSRLFPSLIMPKIGTAGILMFFNYTSARFFSFNNQ
ncbi:GtrA family protein [Candidatus Babeliales bacterium]|nr:GtrA family protein [Candidatus Babeliales bacterium]